MLARQVARRCSRLMLTQKRDDLLFGKPLFSSSVRPSIEAGL